MCTCTLAHKELQQGVTINQPVILRLALHCIALHCIALHCIAACTSSVCSHLTSARKRGLVALNIFRLNP